MANIRTRVHTPFNDWLEEKMLERGFRRANGELNQSQLALYMDQRGEKRAEGERTRSSTVNRWFTIGGVPDPDTCVRIAAALMVPVSEVLQAAGHAKAQAPTTDSMPEWASLILQLPDDDLAIVEILVRKLASVALLTAPSRTKAGSR